MSLHAPEPVTPAVSAGQALPAVHAAPDPTPPVATEEHYTIAIRLNNGDLITAGETDGADKAVALGHAVIDDLTQENGEWPFFSGRFINPKTIVSVDLLSD
jgi:hypothetical protein